METDTPINDDSIDSTSTPSRRAKSQKTSPSKTSASQQDKTVISVDDDDESMSASTPAASSAAAATATPAALSASAPAAAASSAVAAPTATSVHHISLHPTLSSLSFTYSTPPTSILLCPLCSKALYKPVQHRSCGALFCGGCLEQARQTAAQATAKEAQTPACPECAQPVKVKDTCPAAKPMLSLLDALVVECEQCKETMPRSAYESHYASSCSIECPFASFGCAARFPRTEMNPHIDGCAFAPVTCEAVEFGCPWKGQREQAEGHHASCALHAALPVLRRIQVEHEAALTEKNAEIKALRIALETREGQLKSYKDRQAGEEHWKVGTLVDALDTENSWLVAKIIKVDQLKTTYRITYLGWDASWDETLPWDSERLAPGNTHTGSDAVEKHVRKTMAAAANGVNGQTTAGNGAAAAAPAAGVQPAGQTRTLKRKSTTVL
jgi:hypothetical protein